MHKKLLISSLLLLFGSCSSEDSEFEDMESTTIASPSFEKALIEIGVDSDGIVNGKIVTSDIAMIIYLPLENRNISDLSGIENFSGLKKLDCYDNLITSLDVSKNKNLKELDFSNNQVNSINVSQNTALTSLVCFDNQLTSLDVSQNMALATLSCTNNELTSIDVSSNTLLTQLYCSKNLLTSLDVSKNTDLIELFCFENQLIGLDISQNIALKELYCNDNQLALLDVKNGQNTILMEFNASGNAELQCIQIDDENAAHSGNLPYNFWIKDMSTGYAEECNSLQARR
ncbi:leucine-rich repeat domain-containing protein [Pareuzebyella sediminis]|uniref:leucine-rich repeat domain-containing protein n=1 Tax=Pareuzebyella sediminis TaxID=2607998 RepID=UPI0011ED6939|nr:hypothetical protein [Pareuzebyella sediminis]